MKEVVSGENKTEQRKNAKQNETQKKNQPRMRSLSFHNSVKMQPSSGGLKLPR